jgi:hypothetical protein
LAIATFRIGASKDSAPSTRTRTGAFR